jgi:four helix bundle protein
MTEKQEFIERMKHKTKTFAVDVISFCNSLKSDRASSVVSYQIIKSATSTGANYRAACKARSKKEFFSKLCIVVEEIDETKYWLEVILEANLSSKLGFLNKLYNEANEITKIMSSARNSIYENNGNY